jgi:ribose transport system permease protein
MTLAMNGIMEGLTLGQSSGMTCEACASCAPPLVQLAVHGHLLGIPAVLYVWLVVILIVSFVLSFTTFGRATYTVGNSALESYFAGLRVGGVTIALYTLSGIFSALAGIMLVGFGGQAALGMGDPYLFQSIARGGDRRGLHLRRSWELYWYRRGSGDAGRSRECTAGVENA